MTEEIFRRSEMAGTFTAEEFRQTTALFPGCKGVFKSAAFDVLVDKIGLTEAAEKIARDRRAVWYWVDRLYKARVPKGWESVTVTLPKKLAKEVKVMEARERAKVSPPNSATVGNYLFGIRGKST